MNTIILHRALQIEFMESIEELDHLKAEYGFTDSNIHYMTPG